jgi:hypothetical protein
MNARAPAVATPERLRRIAPACVAAACQLGRHGLARARLAVIWALAYCGAGPRVAWLAGMLLLAAGACNSQQQPESVYTLRYATPYPPQHPFSRADQRWIEHVQATSRGKLRIDSFWSGMLTSSDQSVLELRHGVADVAAIQPIYERGGAHVLRTQTGFYAGALG